MGRTWVRLVARALPVLCVAACVSSGATAVASEGAKTIAAAPRVKFGVSTRGELYDQAFDSGFSVAYWTAPLLKGDRVTIRAKATGDDTPPCHLLFMPGTADDNISATAPMLEPASGSRDGSRNTQRFVATATGTYVLALTNDDVFLSAPLQCLAAPSKRPFTFQVELARRGSGPSSARKGGVKKRSAKAPRRAVAPAVVVEPKLWLRAVPWIGEPAALIA